MKNFTTKRDSLVLKLSPIAAGCAVLLSTGVAHAQTAPAAEAPQTVVVSGIRKGIEAAISVKQNNTSIVEAISAEDIGKLPDTTIAESLARLPGLTAQRNDKGEATNVTIRGLGPDFNGYLLNGREQTGTGDSRASDLSVYPAELIAGATVYKTSDAAVVGAGLAGTIDQTLIDPLAFPGRTINAKVATSKNGVGLDIQGKGRRYSLSYIDQFADRKLGLAIGFVKSSSTSAQSSSGDWGDYYPHTDWGDNGSARQGLTNGAPGVNRPITLTNGSTVVPWGSRTFTSGTLSKTENGFFDASGTQLRVYKGRGYNYQTDVNSDHRQGVAAILAFKPNKDFTSQVDVYYAKIDNYRKRNQLQMPFLSENDGASGFVGTFTPGANATGTYSDGSTYTYQTAYASSGTFKNVTLVDRAESFFQKDTLKSIGWKNTLKLGGGWTGVVDLSHNSAVSIQRDVEYYAGALPMDLNATNLNGTPTFTFASGQPYADASQVAIRSMDWSGVTTPYGTLAQAGYSKGPTLTDKVNALRFDLKRDMPEGSIFSTLQLGANYTDRSKLRNTNEGVIESTAGTGAGTGWQRVPMPAGSYVFNNVGGSGLNIITFDPSENPIAGTKVTPKYNNDILSKTFGISEEVSTAFGKLDIDTDVSNIPVRGNVGVQLVHTAQYSSGFRSNVGSSPVLNNPALGGALSTDGTTYNDVLPSLNLIGDLKGGNIVRFALARQLARPNLTDLRNTFNFALDGSSGKWSGSAGNPQLKPFVADAIDLSYEKYFGNKKGYFSAAVFAKNLKSYVVQQSNPLFDFTPYLSTFGLTPLADNKGVLNSTVNGEGGSLKGYELAVSAPFELLTPVLNGFGANASYSYTSSSVSIPDTIGLNPDQAPRGGNIPLPGLSRKNAKATIYFEKWGFSAFVAQNFRSRYVASVGNATVGGFPTLSYIEGQHWVSAQLGYEFQNGPLKGLGFRAEGNNLNSPKYVTTTNGAGGGRSEVPTGRSLIFSLSYKLQ